MTLPSIAGKSDNIRIKSKEFASPSAKYIAEYLTPEWLNAFLLKNAGYGEMHHELGQVAQFVDMHRKFGKIRRAMWDHAPIGSESLREVLMDLIGHCFLTIDLIDKEEGRNDRSRALPEG